MVRRKEKTVEPVVEQTNVEQPVIEETIEVEQSTIQAQPEVEIVEHIDEADGPFSVFLFDNNNVIGVAPGHVAGCKYELVIEPTDSLHIDSIREFFANLDWKKVALFDDGVRNISHYFKKYFNNAKLVKINLIN